jgi:CRP/FNR family cyclic AMP-dependent transcriptional regulator
VTQVQRERAADFDVERYLNTGEARKKIVAYRKGQLIFSQGEPSQGVLYLQRGILKRTVTSAAGKEAITAIFHGGDFFGEECLAGQLQRATSATALEDSIVLEIEKKEMNRMLREERRFAGRFIAHILKRKIRVEADLADQLLNLGEKRLARALLLVVDCAEEGRQRKYGPYFSQEVLAEIIGTTRSRVNFFMNKFRKLGYLDYKDGLQVDRSRLRTLLHG